MSEMTTEQIAEIRARRAAITGGQWEVGHASATRGGVRVDEEYFVRREDDDVSIAADILDPDTCKPNEANAVFIAHAPTDIDLLLADNERLRARVAELESQNVQAAKVILDTRDLLEASEKYMGDNPERWFKTHLRKIVEADSYRTQRYNLNVDPNGE